MAIQHRRGNYTDFDPTKMVAGEPATVLSGDPNSEDGRAQYQSFGSGIVKRLVTYDEVSGLVNQAQTYASESAKSASESEESALEAEMHKNSASESEKNASNSSKLSQSYAKGGTGTRSGENTDNAKYYSEQAAESARSAVRGTRINQGTAITGTSTTPTSYATGLSDSILNDEYQNTNTWNVYRCTVSGNASTAKWVYVGNIKGAQGEGDMKKSVYDQNGSGIVDDSEALDGKSLADLQMSASGVGSIVTLDNTDADKVMWTMLFGKSTQASVPTPTNPVDIVSVGDDGDVKEILCGKNLLNNNLTTQTVNGLTITVKSDKSVVVNGTATATTLVRFGQIYLKKGKEYILNGCPTNSVATLSIRYIDGTFWYNRGTTIIDNGAGSQPFIPTNTISNLYVTMRIGNGETVTNAKIYPMLRFSNYTDIYEPYSGMTATIPLTNPLRAIKVGSGGNYTDESGQQWICDTLEYRADGSGKLVQYIAQYKFTGNETVTLSTIGGYTRYGVNTAFQAENEICESTHFAFSSSLLVNNDSNNKICVLKSNGNCYLRCDSITSVADLQTFFQNNDVYIDYILATPIETDLTPEQVAQFENLQSYYPITTAYTDDIGDLSITCVCPRGKEMADDYVLPKVFGADVESTIADDDTVPFYDKSAKGIKRFSLATLKAFFQKIASTTQLGTVKVDGTTISVDADGTIHSIGVGGITKSGTLTAGQGYITFTDEAIIDSNNYACTVFTSIYGVSPNDISVSAGSIGLYFSPIETDMAVSVTIKEVS